MNIGTKIKELRNHNKITQEDLAKTLCISTQAVSKWENGGSPDLELIPAIAKYFKVSTDYLFDIEDYELTNIENKLFKYIISIIICSIFIYLFYKFNKILDKYNKNFK